MVASMDELLVKTSRTFALAIPLLPEPTRRPVCLSYLLFRTADTLEDADLWSRSARLSALEAYAEVLEARAPEAVRGVFADHQIAFGEGLQLVNILKDASRDAAVGRAYLPSGVSRSEVIALARADLQRARLYIDALERARAPRGFVR